MKTAAWVMEEIVIHVLRVALRKLMSRSWEVAG